METLTVPPRTGHKSLLYSELVTDLDNLRADIAILGMPFGSAYSPHSFTNDQTRAPQVIRDLTDRLVRAPEHYDFDIDGPLLQGRKDIRFVDCGDVLPDLSKPGDHYRRCELAVRRILQGGGLPIVLGGDHGITTPVLRGYDAHGPITLVHVDAHLDWREEVNGVRDGLSSPIRRASELPYVKHIVQ
ncbi:MAG TPA: arginase family protein, partial [Bordetella sp.]|nr:arginase family protein [Bordetella sp.]